MVICNDLYFEVSNDEENSLRSKILTSSLGGSRYISKLFTEQVSKL